MVNDPMPEGRSIQRTILMNKVFKDINDTVPLTPYELAREANAITIKKPFSAFDFGDNKHSRIFGPGHCDCGGNGEFVLLPADHPDVIEGGKRYMQCRKCGGWSHL